MEPVERKKAVEVKVLWQGALIEERQFLDPDQVTIGSSPRADLYLMPEGLPHPAFPIVQRTADGWALTFLDDMDGELRGLDGVRLLYDLVASGEAEEDPRLYRSYRHTLSAGETAMVRIGDITLEVRLIFAGRPLPRGLLGGLDQSMVNATLITVFAAFTLVGSFALFPFDLRTEAAAATRNDNPFVKLFNVPKAVVEHPRIVVKGGAPQLEGAPGKAGRKGATNVEKRSGARPQPPDVRTIVRNTGIVRAIRNGLLTELVNRPVFGTDMVDALGRVNGPVVGEAGGMDGFAPYGDGPGGGEMLPTVHVRDIRVGPGPGDGTGPAATNLGPKKEALIEVGGGTPVVADGLDKELVRRTIQLHRNEVRYCYEKALNARPGLWGKVVVTFTVGAGGAVQSSRIKESTVGDAALEGCIAGRVRGWVFPEPKGGGVVVVSYPFILKRE